MSDLQVFCQNCGIDITGQEKTFYGNVLCGEECREKLAAAVYFRDGPPDEGAKWFCPHCAAENPLGDPRQEIRPTCVRCDKPLDPASATPPKKSGCLSVVLLPIGLALYQFLEF
ncbi:MAG: hypothetical protein P8N09_00565 [Planctomycetota bacterium]|jgi:hypothetical protein|nr:hypothetical protein [Planctomycetota bacterium]